MTSNIDYLPILIQFIFVTVFVFGTIAISHFVGPHRHSKNKDANFECGVTQYGNARIPFSVKYFLVAILFVLFDVEVIFLYPWAVNFRGMGFDGLWKMVMFMSLLLIGFFYIIKKGALDWE
ncbi:MAG TPA: NADH-quinone oxidoreductase subunit A [Chitinophagales bacterium]|nr:NADH-quinone oxidoreductase subunit A [Chitinophagales bacterium]